MTVFALSQRLLPVLLCACIASGQAPTYVVPKPLTKAQLEQLVSAGDNEQLARTVRERGIALTLSGDYLALLRKKGVKTDAILALAEADLRTRKGPLDKELLRELVSVGIDSEMLARVVREHGIDFEPDGGYLARLQSAGATDALVVALHEAAPEPLTQEQVVKMVGGGVPSGHVIALVQRRGVAFRPTEKFLDSLQVSGADDKLLQVLRAARPQLAKIIWTDSATNLMLSKQDNGSDLNWNQANDYCSNLRLGGYSHWRLPTIDELKGIYDKRQNVEGRHIKGEIRLTVWSAWSGDRNPSGLAPVLDFGSGSSNPHPLDLSNLTRALCVRRSGE